MLIGLCLVRRLPEQPLPELRRGHQLQARPQETAEGLHSQLLRENMPQRK